MSVNYRAEIETNEDLAGWYDNKYRMMGGVWKQHDSHLHLGLMEEYYSGRSPIRLAKYQQDIIDLGFGGGDFLTAARDAGYGKLVGIELSAEALKYANLQVPEAMLIKGAFEWLPQFFRYRSFMWVVSIGSFEHVIDPLAVMNAVKYLAAHWYFYLPNELWIHKDQPNERTGTDEEWKEFLKYGGLKVDGYHRNGDNTSFWGRA